MYTTQYGIASIKYDYRVFYLNIGNYTWIFRIGASHIQLTDRVYECGTVDLVLYERAVFSFSSRVVALGNFCIYLIPRNALGVGFWSLDYSSIKRPIV